MVRAFGERHLNIATTTYALYLRTLLEGIPKQNWKDAYARILIGGFGLDRGYTIQGLTLTYLSRSKSKQDDTLLQRARFFGYHKNYNEYVRVFLSKASQNYYSEISEINANFIS